MQTCAGVPGPQGSSEGTSGLVTQRSCRCLVPAESQGRLLVIGQAASVCSPPDQYHCRWVISPGSEMSPCARPGRAALTSSPACPYLHALPQPRGTYHPWAPGQKRPSRAHCPSATSADQNPSVLFLQGSSSFYCCHPAVPGVSWAPRLPFLPCPGRSTHDLPLSPGLGASFASSHFLVGRTDPWGRGPGSVCTQVGNRSSPDPPQAALSVSPQKPA